MKPRREAKSFGRPQSGKDALIDKPPSPSATTIFQPVLGSHWAYTPISFLFQAIYCAPHPRAFTNDAWCHLNLSY
jgi:hypothetical protein